MTKQEQAITRFVNPFYRMGWNDRVRKKTEDYGKVYQANDGTLVANVGEARNWGSVARERYVEGWKAADEQILSLLLPEPS